jgi:integration host factor subunit alpha
MALTKEHLVNAVRNHLNLTKAESAQLVESLLEIIKSTLENGEDVLMSGFGKFFVKEKTDRRGRNPQTGVALTLDARRVVVFRCSSVLRDKLNEMG